jgi:hypothetical protein
LLVLLLFQPYYVVVRIPCPAIQDSPIALEPDSHIGGFHQTPTPCRSFSSVEATDLLSPVGALIGLAQVVLYVAS